MEDNVKKDKVKKSKSAKCGGGCMDPGSTDKLLGIMDELASRLGAIEEALNLRGSSNSPDDTDEADKVGDKPELTAVDADVFSTTYADEKPIRSLHIGEQIWVELTTRSAGTAWFPVDVSDGTVSADSETLKLNESLLRRMGFTGAAQGNADRKPTRTGTSVAGGWRPASSEDIEKLISVLLS